MSNYQSKRNSLFHVKTRLFQKDLVRRVLANNKFNFLKTAKELGISRITLTKISGLQKRDVKKETIYLVGSNNSTRQTKLAEKIIYEDRGVLKAIVGSKGSGGGK